MKKRCLFQGYDCAISICSIKRIADKLEALKVSQLSYKSRVGAGQYLNPMIRDWIHDYGKCKMYALTKVYYLLSSLLVWWARRRYKQHKTRIRKAYKWLSFVREKYPRLFYPWNFSQINVVA
jgi:RNA-directed DNA polymerase